MSIYDISQSVIQEDIEQYIKLRYIVKPLYNNIGEILLSSCHLCDYFKS